MTPEEQAKIEDEVNRGIEIAFEAWWSKFDPYVDRDKLKSAYKIGFNAGAKLMRQSYKKVLPGLIADAINEGINFENRKEK